MRIGLLVDSACDLPDTFIAGHGIAITPITVHLGGRSFVDRRDPQETLAFYRDNLSKAGVAAHTEPPPVADVKRLFLQRLVIDFDCVFALTIAASRSPTFANVQQAALEILSTYQSVRAAAGVQGPFMARVFDTQNLFVGQAIPVIEAARLIAQGAAPNKVRARIQDILAHTYAYLLPSSLYQLRARGREKGDHSVSWLRFALGTALDVKPVVRCFRGETGPVATIRHYDAGVRRCFDFIGALIDDRKLLAPVVALGYGGPLEELQALPGYAELLNKAHAAGVEIHTSIMSITGGIHVGNHGLEFAFAAQEHTFG